MSYNFNKGVQFIGDISGSDDTDRNTGIDFEENIIRMVADGGKTLVVNHDKVGIGIDSPQHRLHISGTAGQVAALVVGDLYVTGSRAKLVVEETDGSDYRVVIDPINGPLVHFGSDTADNHYMTLGAFSGRNNLDTKSRDFHLYGTNTTTGFYFDESAGRFGIGTTTPKASFDVMGDAQISGSLYMTGSLSAEDFMIVAVTEENTNIQTGAEQMVLLAPFDIELTHTPRAFVSSPSTSGVVTVDINKAGSSIFSTNLTIDANEGSSATAATAAVLSTSEIDDGDKITFDVDTAGTSARGLKVILYYRRRLH